MMHNGCRIAEDSQCEQWTFTEIKVTLLRGITSTQLDMTEGLCATAFPGQMHCPRLQVGHCRHHISFSLYSEHFRDSDG
eukprot:UN1305